MTRSEKMSILRYQAQGKAGAKPMFRALLQISMIIWAIFGIAMILAGQLDGTTKDLVQVVALGLFMTPFWAFSNGVLQLGRTQTKEALAKSIHGLQIVLAALFLFFFAVWSGNAAEAPGTVLAAVIGLGILYLAVENFKKLEDHRVETFESMTQADPQADSRSEQTSEQIPEETERERSRPESDQSETPAPAPAPLKPKPLSELRETLNSMIGLDMTKQEVEDLISFFQIQKEREVLGLSTKNYSPNVRLEGPPGTGKTTVARLLAEILFSIGIIKGGQFIEAGRADFVGEWQGQTAKKTNAILDQALDGVIFLDEAYNLVNGKGDSFGMEALNTLLARIENDRDRLTIFVAGYHDEMEEWLNSNPGLKSRFNQTIQFEEYSPEELGEIVELMVRQADYEMEPGTSAMVIDHLAILKREARNEAEFGNGRAARNYFDKLLIAHSRRLSGRSGLTRSELQTLIPEDFETALKLCRIATGEIHSDQPERDSILLS